VAARSYVLATARGGSFDVYDDTRSQVYGGKDSETGRTNTATKRTRGEVVRHRGEVATTYFFSTSGGETESVQFGFPGAEPSPYLKAVKDPYDGASPYHRWRVRYSQAEMESRLSGLFSGRLRRIKVLKRGRSPRIVKARVVGSRGSSRVSGPGLQFELGLRSTWARFHKR
jgi:stage II sporulation protein D